MDTSTVNVLPVILIPDQPLDVAFCSMAQAQSNNLLRYSGNQLNSAYTVTTSGNVGITYTGASSTAPLGAKHMLSLGYRVPMDPHHTTLDLMINCAVSVASRFNLIVYVFGADAPYILDTTSLQANINSCIMARSLAVNNTTGQWLPLSLDFSVSKPSSISIVLAASAYTTSSASLYLYGVQSSWGD